MMNRMKPTSLAFRVWHQFALEWRVQWLLVLLWLAAVALGCWQSLQDERPDIVLPESLPVLLGLMVIVRSVRADAPGNAEAGSHARPLGRGAVWVAKVVFFTCALLVPWLACAWPECRGFGYGAVEWVAEVAERLLLALWLGGLTALCASWSGSGRKNMVIVGGGLLAAAGIRWLVYERGVCAEAAAQGVLGVTLLLAWWRSSLRRRTWPVLVTGGGLAVMAAFWWPWDWVTRPERRYSATEIKIHVGEMPAGSAQELWQGLYLTGVPEDCVANIVSLAPVGGALVFSDYSGVTTQSGKRTQHSRWMTMNHTQALVPHYPAGSLWHGDGDIVRDSKLKEIVGGNVTNAWRLRLSVQKMHRIVSTPLGRTREMQEVVVHPGLRLDFMLAALNESNGIRIWMMPRDHVPAFMPQDDDAALRTGGKRPEPNFIALLHSPGLREVRVAHSNERYASPPIALGFPHPRAQMDIAGMKLEEWIAGSKLDLWWPEELGMVDLEVSAEELRKAMTGR